MTKLRIGRYGFDTALPLPELSRPWGDAFAADMHPDHPAGVYAFVAGHRMPARLEMFDSLKNGTAGILQNAFEYEVIGGPTGQKLGFILEQLPGHALVKDLKQPFQSYKEDNLRIHLVEPIFHTLTALHDRHLFHGGISPLNIFGNNGISQIMLREAVTCPAGFNQPALFEPIERAQCHHEYKGDSDTEDDLFALGITTYLLAIGHNPFAELSDEDLIRARLEVGTSTLLLNHAKLPGGILELVRGLCADAPKQRWTLVEVENWLMGNRVAPRSVSHIAKAARALPFNGKEYLRVRPLAAALHESPAEVRQLVESKEILRWLSRNLGDMPLYEEARRAIEKTDVQTITDDILAARLSMILDPGGPIRYKSLKFMPKAIGAILAHAYATQNTDMQKILTEIISADLIGYWAELPANARPAAMELAREIDRTRNFIKATGHGNGLERVLYEIERNAPCYSEYFQHQYVLSPRQALPALDELATMSKRPTEPLDRHMFAFLIARSGRGKDAIFMNSQVNKDVVNRGVTMLDLLAQSQSRYSIGPVPRLAAWLVESLRPALERFHNRKLRQTLQQNLSKLAAQGELGLLLRAVDSPEVVEGDLRGFRSAMQYYRHLSEQIQEVTILIDNKLIVGEAVGHRAAAGLSVFLAMAAVVAALAVALR